VKRTPKAPVKANAKGTPSAVTPAGKKSKAMTNTAPPKPDAAPPPNPYAVIAERNLFRPLTQLGPGPRPSSPTSPPPGGKMPVLPAGKSGGPPSPAPRSPSSPPGSADFKKTLAFTGVVETPDGTQALIENIQTKECRFVKQGDNAFGCRVTNINSQILSLEKDGSSFTLNIGENKPDSGGAAPPPGGGQPKEGGPPKG